MKQLLLVCLMVLAGALILYLGRPFLTGKTRAQKRAWATGFALVLGSAAFFLGYCGAGVAMNEAVTRLELLWPNFNTLPNTDKGLLVGAAIKCHLPQEPVEVAAVISCIRRGADLLDEHNPSLDAPNQLERLLHSSRLGRAND